ncbi:DUF916 and DUF3324 domain-containing protein [Lacticaseibacillus yichunensis]|uniref:DUF916 and DUF3324 domain-containing protein n=1 Tax=Lacticaseibacillus yichunensis TaxID=2486015 RepID=A0ABW4CUI0_9LACO
MRKQLWRWALALALAAVALAPGQLTQAASQTETTDFEVQPVLPDAQTNMNLNYFDLVYEKNTTHTIQMRVQNFSDKNITVKSDLRNAYTQIGGGIDFMPATKDLDRSLKHPFTTLAKLAAGDDTIKLAPKQMKVISATIKMPTADYKGLIYGDWHFIEHVDKGATSSNAVGSNYAYSVGVVLRGHDDAIFPDLKYDMTEAILYQKHPALGITLCNTAAMAMSKVSVDAAISGPDGAVRSYQATNLMIAPNSKVVFPVSWSYDTMKPGTYQIKVTVKGVNTQNRFPVSWAFKKQMKVTSAAAETVNKQAIHKPVNHWLYASIGTGVALLLSLGALGWAIKLRPRG